MGTLRTLSFVQTECYLCHLRDQQSDAKAVSIPVRILFRAVMNVTRETGLYTEYTALFVILLRVVGLYADTARSMPPNSTFR